MLLISLAGVSIIFCPAGFIVLYKWPFNKRLKPNKNITTHQTERLYGKRSSFDHYKFYIIKSIEFFLFN